MKKFLFLFIILIFISTVLISCNSEPRYTSEELEEKQEEEPKYTKEEWEEIQKDEEQRKEEEKIEEEKRQKISDYSDKIEEFNEFINKLREVDIKYIDMSESEINNFNEAKTRNEQKIYSEILRDYYQEWFNELSIIRVPRCAEKFYDYYLNSKMHAKNSFSHHIDDNSSGFDEEQSKSSLEYVKSIKEFERICQEFNKESEELDLIKPFPELDNDVEEEQTETSQEEVSEQTSLKFLYSNEFPTIWGTIRVVDPLLVEFRNVEVEVGFFLLSDNEVQLTGQIEGLEDIKNIWMPESGIFTMLSAVILDSNGNIKWEQEGYPLNDSYIFEKDIKDFRLVNSYSLPIKNGDYLILVAYMEGGMIEDDVSLEENIDKGVFGIYKTNIVLEE